jgi:hypothetical protein
MAAMEAMATVGGYSFRAMLVEKRETDGAFYILAKSRRSYRG